MDLVGTRIRFRGWARKHVWVESLMSSGKQYRALATSLRTHALEADSANLIAEWEHLASCYDRLAEQADQNERLDVTDEPILRPAT